MKRRKRNRRRFRLIVFLLLFTGALVLLRFRYMPFLREAASFGRRGIRDTRRPRPASVR